MKYVIEFDLPDNDTVLNNIKTAWVGWNVWGYSGIAHAKPKQPERKKGRWMRHFVRPGVYADLYWHCSECDFKYADNWTHKWKYCPGCGAVMEVGEQNG